MPWSRSKTLIEPSGSTRVWLATFHPALRLAFIGDQELVAERAEGEHVRADADGQLLRWRRVERIAVDQHPAVLGLGPRIGHRDGDEIAVRRDAGDGTEPHGVDRDFAQWCLRNSSPSALQLAAAGDVGSAARMGD